MGKKLWQLLFIVLFSLLVIFSRSSPAAVFEGPFAVKNQFPLFIPASQPYLEQASPENSLTLGLSHSSTYMIRDSAHWNVHIDLELTELDVKYRKDIPGVFEIGIDVPVLRASGGFMDRPLAWYHRAFGFPDYGRSKRPRNEFLYDIKKDGEPVFEGDNDQTGFGDTRLTLKRKIMDGDSVLSILAVVELPTGNARLGYGNGSFDSGLALLWDKEVRTDIKIYANAGAVFPGELKALQTIKLENFYYAGAAVEYFIRPDLSVIVQYLAQTSPFPHTGITKVDDPGMLLVLGGRSYVGTGSYEFSLTEDPNTTGAPDFILNLSFKKRF